MSGEGDQQEIDIKFFMESVNEQFKRLNVRLDGLQSAFNSIINPRKNVVGEEEDNDFGKIMLEIPMFEGKNDPELYLRWETKIERIFDCYNFSEEKKVKLAIVEFSDYASIWWDSLEVNRRRNCERPILLWEEMKAALRKRFIPSDYYIDLYRELRELNQGFMSVDEYYQKMETIMFRAHIRENKKATIDRFINGLNPKIADFVDLQEYGNMVELLHEAIRIEKLLKSRKEGSNSSSTWKHKGRDNKSTHKPRDDFNPKVSVAKSKGIVKENIKCCKCLGRGHVVSQCPNKRAMIVLDNGDITSVSSVDSSVD